MANVQRGDRVTGVNASLCSDGRLFLDRAEAEEYQDKLNVSESVEKWCEEHMSNQNSRSDIVFEILEHASDLRDALDGVQ